MSVYLCYHLDRNGGIPAFDTIEAANPKEALSWAERLLQRWPEWEGLEVWDGERRISTLRRAGGA